MTRGEKAFSIIIRLVFIMAFGAFLSASIHHVAVFFQNFEPPTVDNSVSWGSYALAISVDGTALMLTIGMMFFSKGIAMHAKVIVWIFIVCLTAFSWVVNWEYAVTYQTTTLTGSLDPVWKYINPILASSFAFLNLAYSVVSEFFGTKQKSLDDLKSELDGLTGERAQILKKIREAKGPDLIDRAKEKALKVKKAAGELLAKEEETSPQNEVTEGGITELDTLNHVQKVEVKTERITSPLVPQDGTDNGTTRGFFVEVEEEPFMEVSEEEYSRVGGTQNGQTVEPITEVPNFLNILESGTNTDPETEAIHVKSVPQNGSAEGTRTSTIQPFTRRKPMTVAEVAAVLECSERHVRELRADGKLLKDDQDEKLIKASSVKSYLLVKAKKVRVS